jgi:hypothetical protein
LSVLSAGCWIDRYFYQSAAFIHTVTYEVDDLYGTTVYLDPNRGYSGIKTTNVEKYGYGSVSGTTNGYGDDTRNNLSVPNRWTFQNTNGACAGLITYNNDLPHMGTAELRCRVYTGYNHSQYTALELAGDTVDGDDNNVPAPTNVGSSLYANDEVGLTEGMFSSTTDYSLVLLNDGNLVQSYNGNDALWETGTDGSGAVRLLMQGDGNLVMYDGSWNPVWDTGTQGNSGAWFAVQDDGNLVVYTSQGQPLWSRW